MLCKQDIEKAYDHVNWSFLDSIILHLGFKVK